MIIIMKFYFSSKAVKVAAGFGPIMMIWFFVMALGGVVGASDNLGVLAAFNPSYGLTFMLEHRCQAGLLALGAMLTVRRCRSPLWDMGRFGSKPIRAAWLIVVMPSLVFNYLGQGALLLTHPEKLENPFFLYPIGAPADGSARNGRHLLRAKPSSGASH